MRYLREHSRASNLAAPDMLWNWMRLMPSSSRRAGYFALGPLNVSAVDDHLFIWQQRYSCRRRPTQAAMQQKMMHT